MEAPYAAQYSPEGQGVQAESVWAPVWLLKVPEGQGWGRAVPAGQKWPKEKAVTLCYCRNTNLDNTIAIPKSLKIFNLWLT